MMTARTLVFSFVTHFGAAGGALGPAPGAQAAAGAAAARCGAAGPAACTPPAAKGPSCSGAALAAQRRESAPKHQQNCACGTYRHFQK